ncbi:MAG: 16S rRNA (guanine(966)-N(2))-methyltransferase RsmD [Desulfovibrio sp.]|nr:16S rRNA (guanine(966)-N(2))-methyltransferase RsmD [Desulfovibrio sp.]
MRIISGCLAGREIRTPQGSGTRPAMGKTREALFSMLEARGIDWTRISALDLFAGSGTLGFEALSRGAPHATFVDNSEILIRAMARNIENFALSGRCRLARQDVLRFLAGTPDRQYGLAFVDPPYRRNLAKPALERLISGNWLGPGAFVIGELENGLDFPVPAALEPVAERLFGQTLLKIWKLNENSPIPGHI